MKRALALLLPVVLLPGGVLPVQAEPAAWAPVGARSLAPSPVLSLHGVPVRASLFVSPDKPDAVIDELRRTRRQAVHTRLSDQQLMGWVQDGHFVTVKVEPAADGGSRGLWSAVPVDAALRARTAAPDPAPWLPAGSRMGLDLGTRDGAVQARVRLGINAVSTLANARHLIERLEAEGLRLEGDPSLAERRSPVNRLVLRFSNSTGDQAVVTLARQADGDTAITRIDRSAWRGDR